jgi:hypothetical protein
MIPYKNHDDVQIREFNIVKIETSQNLLFIKFKITCGANPIADVIPPIIPRKIIIKSIN